MVLVLLIVVFVPALLKGPRHTPPAASSAPLLPGEPALQSYRSDLKAFQTQLPHPAAPEVPLANLDDAVAGISAGETGKESVPPPAPIAKPQAKAPARAASGSPAPAAAAPARPAKPAAVGAKQPVAKPASRGSSASKKASTPGSRGGWAVQLGGFSSRANAERLASDLKRQGYPAFVSDASSPAHPLFRVRAGPVGDRAEAEALLKRLRAAGHSGSISTNP